MTTTATARLAMARRHQWKVPKMKKPPIVKAATAGTKLGPGRR
jgi:hypothetical protein